MVEPANLEGEFSLPEVQGIIKTVLAATLSDATFDSAKLASWSAVVIDGVLKGLIALARPYKYIVTCVIMQRSGAALSSAAGALWDAKTDGICNLAYESGTIHCLVTVVGLALAPSPQAEIEE